MNILYCQFSFKTYQQFINLPTINIKNMHIWFSFTHSNTKSDTKLILNFNTYMSLISLATGFVATPLHPTIGNSIHLSLNRTPPMRWDL